MICGYSETVLYLSIFLSVSSFLIKVIGLWTLESNTAKSGEVFEKERILSALFLPSGKTVLNPLQLSGGFPASCVSSGHSLISGPTTECLVCFHVRSSTLAAGTVSWDSQCVVCLDWLRELAFGAEESSSWMGGWLW